MRAIVLAAGRGTRLQAADPTPLTSGQSAIAALGAKAAMPVHGRPFLDYVLSGLADAGFGEVCLIVRPDDDSLRPHYQRANLSRVRLTFAVQEEPLGTAHALLTAEAFGAGEPFVVLNADNYYPLAGLVQLREALEPATLAFSPRGLLHDGQIDSARLARFALLEMDAAGYLTDVIEKPADVSPVLKQGSISMNVWRFDERIFDACRGLSPSPRGELELPNAVRRGIQEMGLRIRAVPIDAPVLDLSHRADVPFVTERLANVQVNL